MMVDPGARGRVLIFAKAPIPGQVKTRLMPALGVQGANVLHQRLVHDTLTRAAEVANVEVELWCTPPLDHPFFTACARQFKVRLCPQGEGDLGQRMAHAFTTTLTETPWAILVGTDVPSLTTSDLRAASTALAEGETAVLTPAEDGGYVLIGLSQMDMRLFTAIPWGGPTVAEHTRARLKALGWCWREFPCRWDVDRVEDLTRLARERPDYGDLMP